MKKDKKKRIVSLEAHASSHSSASAALHIPPPEQLLEAVRLLAHDEPLPSDLVRDRILLRRLKFTIERVSTSLTPYVTGRPRTAPADDLVKELHHIVADYIDEERRSAFDLDPDDPRLDASERALAVETKAQLATAERLAPGLLLRYAAERGTSHRPEGRAAEILAKWFQSKGDRVSPHHIRRIKLRKKGGGL